MQLYKPDNTFEKLVSLCKRRGFVFQSSEIYGGVGSTWDYGPLGVELKNNVIRSWWRAVVYDRDDMEGLDSAILMNRLVWKYSGHETTFNDPLVDCKSCKKRFRADHVTGKKCPECGGELTEPRMFNGMFQTYMGPVQDESGLAYLRPETAQGIFVNFLNILQSTRRKLPFGVAQTGKAFRNEITPGNFTFRTREFEQMEIEYFCKPPQFLGPADKSDEQLHDEWIKNRFDWYIGLGIDPSRLRQREQEAKELAHYAKRTVDIEYLFPGSLGWSEIEGVANRQDYDLMAHSQNVSYTDQSRLKLSQNMHSTEKLEYFDESWVDPATGKKGAKYTPFVIEPSAGATRATLAFLCEAYFEEQLTTPEETDLAPLREAIAAALKSIGKKMDDEVKRPREGGPSTAQFEAIARALNDGLAGLPGSLLPIESACALPGADRIELLKKVRQANGKLCDEHSRVVLRLHPALAPVKVAVLPLKKNEPAIVETAQRIKKQLQPHVRAVYDDTAGIGKLYRRQDEIGTPFCVTVDFQTLQDATVTVRDRDSMRQERCAIDGLAALINERVQNWPPRPAQENKA